MNKVRIVGAGLAGSEAALQFAEAGWKVDLFEMRPKVKTPAHQSGDFAELVCSNSLKSNLVTTASGLLKAEMKLLGCKLLPIAETCSVPSGNALAINREIFSKKVTKHILNHPNINFINEEFIDFDDELTILATGPLTSDNLIESLQDVVDNEHLYFFDAIAPIVSADSLNYDVIYRKTRYDKGEADYLNCPFSKEEYLRFAEALKNAEKPKPKEFENRFFKEIKFTYYENCTPIEELAQRGIETLRYGVMRPVGLENPNDSDRRPYAVIQLRAENLERTSYNLVGCQTMMKYGEQKEILRMIPGLGKADFLRYGSIHRNSYLNAPELLNADFSLKQKKNIYVAGQFSGVEGYVESIFSGLLVANLILGKITDLPEKTISKQLWKYLQINRKNFQPMNANFGLLPALSEKIKDKKLKKKKLAEISLEQLRMTKVKIKDSK
ncbi:MAG: methylenetetrahydrofolate--tRNA-(uracil(54)-C(5))-methyltransferase (FADH(2)-oxidizing) TrmFO [Candidatus Cloacimonetes bacterium]|nr:methylenetetrahydrofolate--tRNA-(uracil(54)-C(5))-methyltransferase (FADH(2)-oxidizing) TrmFO [Candidatus Cloacimonadota bacterium]